RDASTRGPAPLNFRTLRVRRSGQRPASGGPSTRRAMSTIAPPRPRRRRRGGAPTPTRPAPLVTYTDDFGIRRELVCVAGAGATRLVIDRLLDGAGDRRLVAHLAADEPPQNAAHVAGAYLAAPRACRLVTP